MLGSSLPGLLAAIGILAGGLAVLYGAFVALPRRLAGDSGAWQDWVARALLFAVLFDGSLLLTRGLAAD
ncbi:MAG: hypothetical protein ACE5EF_10040 [Dehalococcoidia bacterium]